LICFRQLYRIIKCDMVKIKDYLINNWGRFTLTVIIIFIIGINFKPGYFILGNDNYSPELNPQMSFERYLNIPAWREYRVLGVPSDSEQADIVRSGIYIILGYIFPKWLLSQAYVLLSFGAAAIGTAFLAEKIFKPQNKAQKQIIYLVSGLIYITSLITSWMFYSPLVIFLNGYAFLPVLLWRLSEVFEKPGPRNFLWLFITVILLQTSAMVPTTFIVQTGVVLIFLILFLLQNKFNHSAVKTFFLSIIIIFITQLFWMMPFIQYVKTNSVALQESYINRVLTPQLLENEITYNHPLSVLRFYFSWMDIRNDDGTLQFPFRAWYISWPVKIISLLPVFYALAGVYFLVRRKKYHLLIIPVVSIFGWILLIGENPPFGFIFRFLQANIPLFKQVLRWQSSKLFPLLTIPFALLGGYGVSTLVGKLLSKDNIKQLFGYPILGLIVIIQCLFVYQFFTGHLINHENYIKIPQEYYDLANYLQNHDSKGRIYVAPETNTLYFRNYSWGFFGSSILNYIIPNPIIETALTTGSTESESAQQIIERLYNTGDREGFVAALSRYKTPYVLVDRSATRLHNGYVYNWDTFQTVIENNPSLPLVWQEGNISLYQIAISQNPRNYDVIYPNHDFRLLNTILAKRNDITNYISTNEFPGVIFPLNLTFDSINNLQYVVEGTTTYKGQNQKFYIDTSNVASQSSPIKVDFDPIAKKIVFFSALPEITVNNNPVLSKPPYAESAVIDQPQFISVGNTVLDFRNPMTKTYVTENSPQVNFNVLNWSGKNQELLLNKTENKYYYIFPKSAIAEFSVSLSAKKEFPVNICIYSKKDEACINYNHAVYLSKNLTTINILAPRVISAGDKLELYISPEPINYDKYISTVKVNLKLYEDFKPLSLKYLPTEALKQTLNFDLNSGNQIRVSIPKIQGQNEYHFNVNRPFIPPVTHGKCGTLGTDRLLRETNKGSIQFNPTDCYDQMILTIPMLYIPNPDDIAMVYMEGENRGGIPLIYGIRSEKSSYSNFEDRLLYESKTSKISYFPLSQNNATYTWQFYTYSPNGSPSQNTIDGFSFQVIPASWYNLKMLPVNKQFLGDYANSADKSTPKVYQINQSFHPNWTLSNTLISNQPVKINGWQQGWLIDNNIQQPEAVFWPNNMSFFGYKIYLVIGIGLSLWLVLLWVKKYRSARSRGRLHE
jgi:hypothetical protein